MTGLPFIFVFVIAIIVMVLAISKFKIHPFISIMCISLLLGLIAGIPLVDVKTADGKTVQGLANVIGAGFAGTFTSIGIVIILGALIGSANSKVLNFKNKEQFLNINYQNDLKGVDEI